MRAAQKLVTLARRDALVAQLRGPRKIRLVVPIRLVRVPFEIEHTFKLPGWRRLVLAAADNQA